jgi:4'-phosphopantetheinyl transferase
VQVWHFAIADEDLLEAMPEWSVLTSDERRRARRYQSTADGRRFVMGRWALRSVLASQLPERPHPQAIPLAATGRPWNDDAGRLFASVSHAGPLVLVAVARRPVGVDHELRRPVTVDPLVVRRLFSPAESHALGQAGPDRRWEAYLRTWCRKEAVAKGLATGLDEAVADIDTTATAVRGRGGRNGWRVVDVDLGTGWVAAVAAPGRWWTVDVLEGRRTGHGDPGSAAASWPKHAIRSSRLSRSSGVLTTPRVNHSP